MQKFVKREARVFNDSQYTKDILEKHEYVKKPNDTRCTKELEDDRLFAKLRKQVYGKETGKTRKQQSSESPEGRAWGINNLNLDHEGAKASFYSQTMGQPLNVFSGNLTR